MGQVPAATKAMRVLKFLASQPDPVPLDRIMRACDLPRSTAYHLMTAMAEEGFVTHLADERRYGLGVAAFEVGSGYSRQSPPAAARPSPSRSPQSTTSASPRTSRCHTAATCST